LGEKATALAFSPMGIVAVTSFEAVFITDKEPLPESVT
jgi:hypothetical protein